MYNKDGFYHSKDFFGSCKILSLYKLNLLNTAIFMHKIKNKTSPSPFLKKIKQPSPSYPTPFSSRNYRKPQIKLLKCRFRSSTRGPATWNDLARSTEKEIQLSFIFKTKIKNKFLNFEHEVAFAFKNSLSKASTDGNERRFITTVRSCLCFVSTSRGMMKNPVGVLWVHPLKFC